MNRNSRNLVPTNEKFTKKFSRDKLISPTIKLPEGVTPPQTAKSPESVTSLTTINPSKLISPNGTKST